MRKLLKINIMKFLNIRTCHIANSEFEESVDSSLALTPADMSDLTSQGRTVSISSLEGMSFYGNEPAVEDMPLEHTRGIDMNTLYEASQASRRKLRDFQRSTKNTRVEGEQQKGAK